MRLEKLGSTAIEPGLATLLAQEQKDCKGLPLAIRRFVEQVQATGIVDAALGVTGRLLQEYQDFAGPLGSAVRLTKLAQVKSVVLRGLNNVSSTGTFDREFRQRYRATISMGGGAPVITIPPGSDRAGARISVAHELGHLLIHSRGAELDEATIRLGSSNQEEALAEYLARLLLLSSTIDRTEIASKGIARFGFDLARSADVPLSSALARLGDPDQDLGIAGVILWELRRDRRLSVAERLKPYSRFCGTAFIPQQSHARDGSLTVTASVGEGERIAVGVESVRIGGFVGEFKVEAYGWGSEDRGTRKVLSTFSSRE
jgi:hypothetical protein